MKKKKLEFLTFPVSCHTNNIGPGSTFVAINGSTYDGATFIAQAIENGARKVVVEKGVGLPIDAHNAIAHHGVELVEVANTRLALAQLSAQAAGFPANRLKIIGITGTKGKTTTAFLLHHILYSAGIKVALLSTVHNQIGDKISPATLTTAQPDFLHQFFAQCVRENITHVVMEVAAQAFTLYRVEGIQFAGGIFTNFSHEHLEFYKNLDEYFQAKCELFKQCVLGAPVLLNADDAQVAALDCGTHTFGVTADAGYRGFIVSDTADGLQISLRNILISCPTLFGQFNASNILAAVAMAHQLGLSFEQSACALAGFSGVAGRLERYAMRNGALFIIDYAHNPDSYRAVLCALRAQTNQLIVVFGAGGKRDKSKRPLMGTVAAQFADTIILTSDNPRDEDPASIVADIHAGIPNDSHVIIELDRQCAIERAYQLSNKQAIIALLGKGPDEYQIVGTSKTFFSEKEIIASLR